MRGLVRYASSITGVNKSARLFSVLPKHLETEVSQLAFTPTLTQYLCNMTSGQNDLIFPYGVSALQGLKDIKLSYEDRDYGNNNGGGRGGYGGDRGGRGGDRPPKNFDRGDGNAPKDRGFQVFVTRLPEGGDKVWLENAFKAAGLNPIRLYILMDRETRQFKTSGFATFESQEEVDQAILLKELDHEGKNCKIFPVKTY